LLAIALIGFVFSWHAHQKKIAHDRAVEEANAAAAANLASETKPPEKPAESAPAAVIAENPPAPRFRLQMITFVPGHPSALISGRTVRLGDFVDGFRVAAITQSSATLVSATETNVLMAAQ
jgi:hypothetical protein